MRMLPVPWIRRCIARPVAAVTAVALVSLVLAGATQAQERLEEGHVKAAVLFNFAKFVQWPADRQDGPIVIGIVGDDLFAELVGQVTRGKSVQGREIVTRRLGHQDDVTGCHVLFIGGADARWTPGLLGRLESVPVLTVGETAQFIRDGGIARLFMERNRVQFQISRASAEKAGIKVHSQLLDLARP